MCLTVTQTSNQHDLVVTGSKDHYVKVPVTALTLAGVWLEPPLLSGLNDAVLTISAYSTFTPCYLGNT